MEFFLEIIHKSAIDRAKEYHRHDIIKLLSKGPIEKEDLKSVIMKDVSTQSSIQRNDEESNLLKNLLFSLKEKTKSIQFIDLNDYEIDSVIGEGATSSVKLIIKKEKYALKELKELTFEQMRRLLSECEILFLLHHPCIVRVFGFNNGDDTHPPSMILSFEPTSLEKAIYDKILENHQKNLITVEIVLGMRYIHKKNFMHRDLKPSNILLSKNMHVKISDFGFAKEENLEISQSKGIGTLRFMAPELFDENEEIDESVDRESDTRYNNKVDVYSFGIVLIYIVTEKYPPFSMKNVVTGVLPKLKGPIVDWVKELIVRCLSLSPDNRPSFAEIFEIMKSHNYDLFNDNNDCELTIEMQNLKKEIENRILKIEAFEYQHQDE